MSTRSYIGIVLPKDTKVGQNVKGIYVHSDGYPDGVGHTLLSHYNTYDKAIKLFDYGDASSLDDTILGCSFYSRDWARDDAEKKNKAKLYNNEYTYYNSFSGDIHIEFIYLFKDGQWKVAEMVCKYHKVKNAIKDWYVLHKKPIPVVDHKDYTGKKDLNVGSEKIMGAQIGSMLSKTFGEDNLVTQGFQLGKKRKLN
jgi:hypothetical protein